MKRVLLTLTACLLCAVSSMAQKSLPSNVNHTSYPLLMPDGSVSFRVNATDAKNVAVEIWGVKTELSKNSEGIWEGQTKPLMPGFHYYNLLIDGAKMSDPASTSYYGSNQWSSAIDIPEDGCEWMEVQNVPHGDVRTVWYFSSVQNEWRQLMVYTPAGYDKGKDKYPVVYIHHGSGEDHTGWMRQGRVGTIMDNLIAEKKAVPMIIVSSNSNVTPSGISPSGYSYEAMQPFREELLNNIIPFIEKTYRVKKGRTNRAMCGLSMGGGQSFYIGLRAPEVFANIGIFSAGVFRSESFDIEKECPGIYTDSEKFNKNLDLFFISCGENDPRITSTTKITQEMKEHGVDVIFKTYPGDHEWQPWRKSIHDFAQMLFK